MERPPLTLTAVAAALTAGSAYAAWCQWPAYDPLSWLLLWPPLASMALLRRSRAAWGFLLGLSFFMAAFAAMIAWSGSHKGSPAWFLEHFRGTSLFWLCLAALLGARPSRSAVWAPAQK